MNDFSYIEIVAGLTVHPTGRLNRPLTVHWFCEYGTGGSRTGPVGGRLNRPLSVHAMVDGLVFPRSGHHLPGRPFFAFLALEKKCRRVRGEL